VEFSRALWHGHATDGKAIGLQNRWVDKPCEFIVYDNAKAGLMGEHSVMDGTPTQRMCDDVLDMLDDPSFDHGSTSLNVEPTPLDWKTTPEILGSVESANKAAVELIDSQHLSHLITNYGKSAIKNFGVSPDSWAQMIVQLAYRRLLGDSKRNGGTYEAASTRRFFKGRTEAIRVVSSEADAWTKSMDEAEATLQDRKRLFDAATKKHVQLAKLCGSGQGIDRHFLGELLLPGHQVCANSSDVGLKLLLKEGEAAPALFSDPVFQRSSRWVLSTSAINSRHFGEHYHL
jgi:carnitine O-acetyltransferase